MDFCKITSTHQEPQREREREKREEREKRLIRDL